jgi:hypothetical protein
LLDRRVAADTCISNCSAHCAAEGALAHSGDVGRGEYRESSALVEKLRGRRSLAAVS